MKRSCGFLVGKAGFARFAVLVLVALILLSGCPTGGTGSGNDTTGAKTTDEEAGDDGSSGGSGGGGGGSNSSSGGGSGGGGSGGGGNNTGGTAKTGTLDVSIGFNYGEITVLGSDGVNSISRWGSPDRLTLRVSGYKNVIWYVDSDTTPLTASPLTLYATDYPIGPHTLTFNGDRDGGHYSKMVSFTVTAGVP
jgi:hypothetical protein